MVPGSSGATSGPERFVGDREVKKWGKNVLGRRVRTSLCKGSEVKEGLKEAQLIFLSYSKYNSIRRVVKRWRMGGRYHLLFAFCVPSIAVVRISNSRCFNKQSTKY